jgi:CO dehydrogenase maturation factor
VTTETTTTESRTRPIRVAFVGKGGAGKSAIVGTLARILARTGQPTLVLDSDPMPGLALSLGLPTGDEGIPDDAVVEVPEREEGPRFRLREGLSAEAAVEQYALVAPDGVRFLQIGKLRGHVRAIARSQHAFHQIKTELPADRWNVIGDLPGGTRQPFLGWASFAEAIVVVVEASAKGVLSGRRLANLAGAVVDADRLLAVVSKARHDDDAREVEQRTGLRVIGSVPWDDALADAERRGVAPIDGAPDGPAVRAVGSLADTLRGELA